MTEDDGKWHLVPTEIRLNKAYIIGYTHWTWTGVTVLIPFFRLLFLSMKIFIGLKKLPNWQKRLDQSFGQTEAGDNNDKKVTFLQNNSEEEEEVDAVGHGSTLQAREASMGFILVCTVLMFIICHAPRVIFYR